MRCPGSRQVLTDPATAADGAEAAAAQLARAGPGRRARAPTRTTGTAWPPLTDDRPLRTDQPVRVSPSKVEEFDRCALRWLLLQAGGSGQRLLLAEPRQPGARAGRRPARRQRGASCSTSCTARWGVLGLGRGLGRRHRPGARRAGGATSSRAYLAEAGGRELVGTELDVDVELALRGRAGAAGRAGRPARAHHRRPARGRPQDRQEPARPATSCPSSPQLGAYQLAVQAGAFEEQAPGVPSAGAQLVQLGTHGQEPVGAAAAGAAGRRWLGHGARRGRRPRHGPVGLRRQHERDVRPLPGAHLVPRARRGAQGDVVTELLERPAEVGQTRPSAAQIARALGRPEPTPEQAAVIEAPMQPLVVVAGAGSGKTETMASRVVWLVAGGDVAPDEVLGLTFTRKAAGELAERIRSRLRALRRTGLWRPDDDAADLDVSVSTYHAYAGRLVREHGLRLGYEPEARLLTEAACWQLATEIVEHWAGDMDSVEFAASPPSPRRCCSWPARRPSTWSSWTSVDDYLAHRIAADRRRWRTDDSGGSRVLADVARPADRGCRRGARSSRSCRPTGAPSESGTAWTSATSWRVAAELAQRVPQLGELERGRYRAVLLDEFQDTSHAQLVMLEALFGGGHGVTAVGDPHQSIYGWRGASADTLAGFAERFRVGRRPPAHRCGTCRPAGATTSGCSRSPTPSPQPLRSRTAVEVRAAGRAARRRAGRRRGGDPADRRARGDGRRRLGGRALARPGRPADPGPLRRGAVPSTCPVHRHRGSAAAPRPAVRGGRARRAAVHPRGRRPGLARCTSCTTRPAATC